MASKVSDDSNVTIRLHKRERGAYFSHPGIVSVTFCQGDPHAAYASLKSKVLETLAANPWVGGRLDKQKNLTFNPTVTDADVDDILSICKNANVHRRQAYPKLVAACAKDPNVTVQTGKKMQKSGGRITKCVVVEPDESGGEFAIVFSMSHAAADGHDYYRIYNMICGTDPVDAMDPVRVAEYEATEFKWTGKKDFAWLSGGGGLIKGMLTGACCGPKAKWCCYTVDADKVSQAQAKSVANAAKIGADEVKFVSTNDVLTTHFCKATQARVVMVVVNFRDKIPDLPISDKNAGCYEGCLLLDRENYADPACIRLSLIKGLPLTRHMPSPPLPGCCCSSNPMALITSWANGAIAGGRFNATNIAGVEAQALHLPCMDMPDMMDVAIVFKSTPNKYAVICFAKRASPDTLMGPDTVYDATVDATLFPL